MMRMGFEELAAMGAAAVTFLLVASAIASRGRAVSSTQYVIKRWTATSTPADVEGTYVMIEGRQQGLLSWILALIGVDSTVRFMVQPDNIVFTRTSWGGRHASIIPIRHINAMHSGYTRPWKSALVFGLVATGILYIALDYSLAALPVGLVAAVVLYMLNKSFELSVFSGSQPAGFVFKRSVIEGRKIDEDAAQNVVNIMRALVDARR